MNGLQERLFTLVFSGLVYPQIWEDPEVDREALRIEPDSHVVTIASGGCNVLSYLLDKPRKLTALDLNRAHISLTRLKLTAAERLSNFEQFYSFFGLANEAATRGSRCVTLASQPYEARLCKTASQSAQMAGVSAPMC